MSLVKRGPIIFPSCVSSRNNRGNGGTKSRKTAHDIVFWGDGQPLHVMPALFDRLSELALLAPVFRPLVQFFLINGCCQPKQRANDEVQNFG
jgi:hypothetical protein